MKMRAAVVGGILGLFVSLALLLRLVAVGNAEVGVLLAPAMLSSAAALLWSRRAWVLATAAVGMALTGSIFLIGGAGLLYLPSLILFLIGVAQACGPGIGDVETGTHGGKADAKRST